MRKKKQLTVIIIMLLLIVFLFILAACNSNNKNGSRTYAPPPKSYNVVFRHSAVSETTMLINYNSDFSLPYSPISPDGYKFEGWAFIGYEDVTINSVQELKEVLTELPKLLSNSATSFLGITVTSEEQRLLHDTIAPYDTIIFIPKFKKIQLVTLSFESNGGSIVSELTQDSDIDFVRPVNPIRDGFIFRGWYFDENLTVATVFPLALRENIVVYAKWSEGYTVLEAGRYHSFAITTDGSLCGWGRNNYGQLGDGTTTDRNLPVYIKPDTKFVAVSAHQWHTVAIDADGNLWAWGYNANGRIGDGTNAQRNKPVRISSGTIFIDIAVGGAHSMAIDSNGNIWGWGQNSKGQLGDGTTNDRWLPTQITTDTKFKSIQAGWESSYAIDEYDNLWSWGDNGNGRLGDGTTTSKVLAVQILKGTKVVSISAWDAHCLAIDSSGNLWSWGRNSSGQLGDGTTIDRSIPIKICNGMTFFSASAGMHHSLALDSSGNAFIWGSQDSGALGNGQYSGRNLNPTQFMNEISFSTILAGDCTSFALDIDNNLWAVGYNQYGQLGNGSNSNIATPVEIRLDSKIIFTTQSKWKYSFSEKPGWYDVGYNDIGWDVGNGIFSNGANGIVGNSPFYTGSQIYLRKSFMLSAEDLDAIFFIILMHDDEAKVYINGILAFSADSNKSSYYAVSIDPSLFIEDYNTIAIWCHDIGGLACVDAGLIAFYNLQK